MRRRLQAAIVLGGIVGGLTRAGLEQAFPWDGRGWPWVTYVVNVAGALLLGYFVTRLQERLPPSSYPRPFLGTGFCGALTTFSTLQLEFVTLIRDDRIGLAAAYLSGSVAAGFAAVYAGTVLARNPGLR